MLNEIIKSKKSRLGILNQKDEISRIKSPVLDMPPVSSLAKNLRAGKFVTLIAEIKRSSPSKGILVENLDVGKTVQIYEKAGASGVSVLTETDHFGGSIEDLKIAKKNCSLPVLRKDFILEEYQVWESRYIGADAILLIAGLLDPERLLHLYLTAKYVGLEVLIEIHNVDELNMVIPLQPELVGINNRDLKTFEIDLETTEILAPLLPPQIIRVAESGILSREDILRMHASCVDAVLVGEKLVTSNDPGDAIRDFLGKSDDQN